MTAAEFLRWCVDILQAARIDYMVVGSVASSHHGEVSDLLERL